MKLQFPRLTFRSRARAAAIHLGICAVVAALAAALVFLLWYPWPYRVISGGQGLFILVISVDLVLGPLLTFAVFDTVKGWRHLRRDLAVIGALQLAALVYGLNTVYAVRPAALVFEVDRFRAIAANEVYLPELQDAPEAYRHLPLIGPWVLGARRARTGDESNDALFKGLEGVDPGQRPKFWQPYQQSKADALARSRPVALLIRQYPTGKSEIEATLRGAKLSTDDARFLPLTARVQWVVLLDKEGNLAGFAPFDGFF
jgi:hypothetical protein